MLITSENSFTIEVMRKDDPRLRQFLEIPEEEKQSSFYVPIQLLPGSDELEIEDVSLWSQCHLPERAAMEALSEEAVLI
jgi:hypothetical protein